MSAHCRVTDTRVRCNDLLLWRIEINNITTASSSAYYWLGAFRTQQSVLSIVTCLVMPLASSNLATTAVHLYHALLIYIPKANGD